MLANLAAERDAAHMVAARQKVETKKSDLTELQSSKGFDGGIRSSEASELWDEFRELALARGFRTLARFTQAYEAAYSNAKESRGRALVIKSLRKKI